MKRRSIRPGKCLKREAPLRPGGRIRAKGRRRFAGRSDPDYRAWIRQQPCILAGSGCCRGVVEACHVKSKGAGGGDRANLYPACSRHHAEQHAVGIRTFQAKYSIDLRLTAARFAVAYTAGFLEEVLMPMPTNADRLEAALRKLAGALRDALGELEAPLAPPGRNEAYRLQCVQTHLHRAQAQLIIAGSLVPAPENADTNQEMHP